MIFLVAYGGGHVSMLAPIASALADSGRPFTFLALTTARATLDRLKIPSIGFRDLPDSTDDDVQKWGRMLAAELPIGGLVEPQETIAYLGANFRDLVQDVGEVEAWRRYRISGRQAFLPIRTLKKALSLLAPSLVIATSAPRAERAAILAAGSLGIPSICAVDLFALQEVQWIGQPGYADRVCVLNESVREFIISHGRQSHEIIVTGNPAFDRLTEAESLLEGSCMRHNRGWDDGKVTLLWASQIEQNRNSFSGRIGDPTLPRRIEKELRAFVANHSDYRLVVRYHPSERIEFVPGERVEFSPTQEPLSALLHAVDVVVITASTVGLEATLAGRPVISVKNSVFSNDTLYSKMGVRACVDEPTDLPQALLDLGDPTRDHYGQLPLRPGLSSTQRLLGVIESLMR